MYSSRLFKSIIAAVVLAGGMAMQASAQCPGTLIVNEVSNGDTLNAEWIELVALPVNGCISDTLVDISGMLIDDHNGIYTGGPMSGTGITNGHWRLAAVPLFQHFRAGNLLVLYNAAQIDQGSPNTLQTAFTGRNAQGVTVMGNAVFVAVGLDSVVEYNASVPTPSSGIYCSGTYVTGDVNSWNAILLNNDHDAVEVLCPGCRDTVGEPFVFHAFGYDDVDNLYSHYNNPVSGFLDGAVFLFDTADHQRGTHRAFQFFQGIDPGADTNWRAIDQSTANPGAYNTAANQNYVTEVLTGDLTLNGCSDTLRIIEPAPDPTDAVLVITEYSQGQSNTNCEYVEIFVGFAGTTKPGKVADITGWIVDDNAGTFSACTSGRGISAGHLRFPNRKLWRTVPYGSRIVLYNPSQNCNNFTSTGNTTPTDSVYFVAVGSDTLSEYTSSIPSSSNSCLYCTGTYSSPGNFSVIEMSNGGDGIQVRCPGCPTEPIFYHGSTWGSNMSGLTSPNLGALDLGSASASVQTHEFYQNNNVQTSGNWRRVTWTLAASTASAGKVPNAFKTAALNGSLNFPRCGAGDRSEMLSVDQTPDEAQMEVLSIYPNPASGVAYADLVADNGGVLTISDLSGRTVRSITIQPVQGQLQHITIDLTAMAPGVYMYTLNNGKEISAQGKFIVAGK